MPRASRITPALIAEVRTRKASGEEWKFIARDLRARGYPFSRNNWWRHYANVPEPRNDCASAAESCMPT